MRTAGFKMTFVSGLMGLAYSKKEDAGEKDENEERQPAEIEESPAQDAPTIEEPEMPET